MGNRRETILLFSANFLLFSAIFDKKGFHPFPIKDVFQQASKQARKQAVRQAAAEAASSQAAAEGKGADEVAHS